MADVTMRVWRGDEAGGTFTEYVMPAVEGEVVLDVIHRIQAGPAPDLACRWNCKAGKCGSCSAEINGLPKLMCMTRMDVLPEGEPVVVAPMRTFPIIRDLVTDVSFNYTMARQVPPLKPRAPEADGTYRMHADRHRARAGIPQVHRMLHVPGRVPRHPGPRGEQGLLRRAAHVHPLHGARVASSGHRRPARAPASAHGARHVQHHQVLHRGVSRAHQDHRQRHHPLEGTGRRRLVRPRGVAGAQDPAPHQVSALEAALEAPGQRTPTRQEQPTRPLSSATDPG